ncbi:carbamoyl-phosphate synthase domain-containing protein, partial [Streptomyces albidoflavus]
MTTSTRGAGQDPAVLVLEDGRTFRGRAYGAVGETFGEAVFSTGMTGYQETLTDPSYHRQVVVMTAPHVGNTGVNDEDPESRRIWVSGYVVRDPARRASNWRSQRSLDEEPDRARVAGDALADLPVRGPGDEHPAVGGQVDVVLAAYGPAEEPQGVCLGRVALGGAAEVGDGFV